MTGIEGVKDRLALGFFGFAAALAVLAAWEQPSLLAWLAALHNAVLTCLYARRLPARRYDRSGFWLGALAAVLPLAAPYPEEIHPLWMGFGLCGYGLTLWALLSLGGRFGVAPADRGLVTHGPYRWLRHPVYTGELMLRLALAVQSPQPLLALLLWLALAVIQVLRARREETILGGYAGYAGAVRYRLLPGVW